MERARAVTLQHELRQQAARQATPSPPPQRPPRSLATYVSCKSEMLRDRLAGQWVERYAAGRWEAFALAHTIHASSRGDLHSHPLSTLAMVASPAREWAPGPLYDALTAGRVDDAAPVSASVRTDGTEAAAAAASVHEAWAHAPVCREDYASIRAASALLRERAAEVLCTSAAGGDSVEHDDAAPVARVDVSEYLQVLQRSEQLRSELEERLAAPRALRRGT